MNPRFAVVTVVRNAAAELEATIDSVAGQRWREREHIVVDGASTDGTLAVVRDRARLLGGWTSGPDGGIYDAMNKGLDMVRDPEAYVLFLNAGDLLAGPDVLGDVARASGGADLVYGDIARTDGPYRVRSGGPVTSRSILFARTCHHQAAFVRRRVFDRIGRFDASLATAGDYDFMLRAFAADISRRYAAILVSEMPMGGASDRLGRASFREKIAVLRARRPGPAGLAAAAVVAAYEMPRAAARDVLRRRGLLAAWRALKGGGGRPCG